jgi:hypothetical protein
VVFVADDLGAWLVGLLADAGRKKLTTFVLGSDQKRALRRAATAAVQLTAEDLDPAGGEQAGHLAMVVSEVFSEPMPDAPLTGQATVLETLQTGIARQLAVLDDVGLTGIGQSSADVLGVRGTVLAEKLTNHLIWQIVLLGSQGGALAPLAAQLNHDVTHLQGQRLEGMLATVADQVREALAQVGPTGEASRIRDANADAHIHAESQVSSAYLYQVREIAPRELRGRDDELAELAAFCGEPSRGPYVWWQAPPWTGKSALLSWFVLHPPPSVQIVSFFVTARYKGQDERVAFIDSVMAQLADMLGQPIPAYLPETTREAYLLRMFADAAEICQQRHQRLVLVVDGLDEDRGVTTGPDAYSIAAVLPRRPVGGLRVIVAGRPAPPIPPDVPDDHPLRDTAIVRVLARSPWAEVVKADMQRELKRLLHGAQTELDLLGLVTAAGGGLSAQDLAELTGLPVYEVEENLHAVAGRTFASRVSRWQPGIAPPVYVLGHEELQVAATGYLGQARLTEYQQRLHYWAEDYRQRGWPTGTPEYLLRGYFRMLYANRDIPRLVACAADQARHDRMLDVTGGDAAALNEIADTQNILLGLADLDLLTMARLAVRRISIAERNASIPFFLPAAWARAGCPERAEALAHAITPLGARLGRVLWIMGRGREARC